MQSEDARATKKELQHPSPQPSTVSPTRHVDGHTRTHQNLMKRHDISTHFRLNHGPCRSQEQRLNSTQLNSSHKSRCSAGTMASRLKFLKSRGNLDNLHPLGCVIVTEEVVSRLCVSGGTASASFAYSYSKKFHLGERMRMDALFLCGTQ